MKSNMANRASAWVLKARSVNEFAFEGGKETFTQGIIKAILLLPAFSPAASGVNRSVDIRIRSRHMLEALPVDNKVGAQQI